MLAKRIIGLPIPFLLSCFVSRLVPNICCEVQALQPLTLVQAAGLARLQEEKIAEHQHSFHGRMHSGPGPGPSSSFTAIFTSITFTNETASPTCQALISRGDGDSMWKRALFQLLWEVHPRTPSVPLGSSSSSPMMTMVLWMETLLLTHSLSVPKDVRLAPGPN